MQDIQLTPHFRLSEFTHSDTAIKHGIDNTLDPSNPAHAEIIANLRNLCEQVLEPFRTYVDGSSPLYADGSSPLYVGSSSPLFAGGSSPLYVGGSSPLWGDQRGAISSGYRCPELNSHPEIRGAAHSQHMLGQAADIYIPKDSAMSSDGTYHTNLEILDKWMRWLIDNTDFDHCIRETANRRTYWIHISCLRDRKQNRHKVTHFLLKS